MTPEQNDIVEPLALMLAARPKCDRPALMTLAGVDYEQALERERPDLSREDIVANSREYTVAVLSRVREIDESTGGAPQGRA